MTKEDYVNLAFFLGEQLQLLHSLPAPSLSARCDTVKLIRKESSAGDGHVRQANGSKDLMCNSYTWCVRAHVVNQLDLAVMVQSHNCRTEKSNLCNVPIEWQYFVGFLREQRANAMERFLEW
jgi:hypothetical protein